ncbi:MAG: hypothetical protein Tsb0016_20330 [Sphingomonadales bacterium]
MRSWIAAILICALTAHAAAQAPEADEFEIPQAPAVQPPGWPPPDDLCALADSWDFNAEPLNPGLYTVEQFRTWSISGIDRDDPEQLFFLGLMHEYGQGLLRDMRRASELYKRAAEAGIDRARLRLGKYYCNRELFCLAARTFYDGAVDDDGDNQMMLSKLYRWDLGVYYDPIEAYRWGYLAMEKTEGNWLVQNMEGVRYLRALQDILMPEELIEAERRIERWKKGLDVHALKCKVD